MKYLQNLTQILSFFASDTLKILILMSSQKASKAC